MLFTEYAEVFEVWRLGAPGALSDPTWTLQTTVSGRFEPVQGTEEFLHNQSFADVTELLFLPIGYASAVRANDGIVSSDGTQRRIVGQPEIWKNMIPHVVCKMERAQWTIGA